MKKQIQIARFFVVAILVFMSLNCDCDAISTYNNLQKLFINPPREYANSPLWVWNDMLTEDQIISTMKDLSSQGVKQVFVHPRPGLMIPYLSKEWFKLWKVALKQAER
jgi:hypothetical protein